MAKEDIKFGIAFTNNEWQKIRGALHFKIKRAEEMGMITYVDDLMDLDDYIKFHLKRMN